MHKNEIMHEIVLITCGQLQVITKLKNEILYFNNMALTSKHE